MKPRRAHGEAAIDPRELRPGDGPDSTPPNLPRKTPMTIRSLLSGLAVCLALGSTNVLAEASSRGDEMERAHCGGIIDLFISADPGVNKDEQALAAAQDRTYVFLMWAHGYLSGRDGIDFARRPLNQDGITALVGEIHEVCRADEGRLFLDAVKEIR